MNVRSLPVRAVIAGVALLMSACGSSGAGRAGSRRSGDAGSVLTSPPGPAVTSTAVPPTPPSSTTTTATTRPSRLPVASGSQPCGWATNAPPTYKHVVWIWMENHQGPAVLGPDSPAPYEKSLAGACGTAIHYASVGSPSLPNYIGATSGSTQGITDDGGPSTHVLTGDNLFRQVRAAGGSARSFEEAMNRPCQLGPSGRYAVKHNPAAYYAGGQDRAACGVEDVPLGDPSALTGGPLPTFAFVTPDLCHDTHDCGVATGDTFLAGLVPALLATPEYRSGATAIFVIWDEPTPMPNLMVAPSVHPGTVVSLPVDHYALLRTTEEMLGLSGLLGAAAQAPSMRAPFNL